jgi:hypothetical protein
MEDVKEQEGKEKSESDVVNIEEYKKINKLNQIYLFIISKYKDYIESGEKLSVAELPTMIMPKIPSVLKKANEIKETYTDFVYEVNFVDVSIKAFDFVKNEIEDVSLPIQFWLTPEETLKFMSGDITDKNMVLCSLLIALGNPSAKVLVVINNNERKIVVYYEFNNSFTMLDLDDGIKLFSAKEDMLKSLGMTEDSIVYEFNDQMYIDIM